MRNYRSILRRVAEEGIGPLAAVLFLVVPGMPVLMMVLQAGECSGMPAPCQDDSPAMGIALVVIAIVFAAIWWLVRKYALSISRAN